MLKSDRGNGMKGKHRPMKKMRRKRENNRKVKDC